MDYCRSFSKHSYGSVSMELLSMPFYILSFYSKRKQLKKFGKSSLFATAFEPALPSVMADFGSNNDALVSLTISIYVVGYCIGPLIIAPVSELYGRLPVVYLAFVTFLLSLVVCGISQNIVLFLIFRVMSGLAPVAFLLMGPAIAADIIPKERRGLAMSLLTIGPIAVCLKPITPKTDKTNRYRDRH